MDIDGVEADYLSHDEVFELFDGIVDYNEEEFLGLENINTNDLKENSLQELYDNLLYSNDKMFVSNNADNLSDTKFMDINRNVVDFDNSEIVTLNGINFDINSLSDEEISSLYDDSLLTPDYIATTNGTYTEQNATSCYSGAITSSGSTACMPVTCATSDTSVSTSGYISFQMCVYNSYGTLSQIHNDMNSGGSGGNESCYYMYLYTFYTTSPYAASYSYGYKQLGFYIQCYYKYYNKYGASYDYVRLASSYDTGAK